MNKDYASLTRRKMEKPFKPLNRKEPGFWTWVKDLLTVKTDCQCEECLWANKESKR